MLCKFPPIQHQRHPLQLIFFDFDDKVTEADVLKLTEEQRVFLTGIKQQDLSDELLDLDLTF